jgi:hypothetical protein
MMRTYKFLEKRTRRSGAEQRAKCNVIITARTASDRAGCSYLNWIKDAFISLLLFDKICCSLSNNIITTYLNLASESEHKVQSGLLGNIIVAQCAIVFQLFSCKNEALLIRWSPDLPFVSK